MDIRTLRKLLREAGLKAYPLGDGISLALLHSTDVSRSHLVTLVLGGGDLVRFRAKIGCLDYPLNNEELLRTLLVLNHDCRGCYFSCDDEDRVYINLDAHLSSGQKTPDEIKFCLSTLLLAAEEAQLHNHEGFKGGVTLDQMDLSA